jgi:hypothetical protein
MFINFKSCTDQFICSYLEYLNCITTKWQGQKYVYIYIYVYMYIYVYDVIKQLQNK